MDGDTIHTHTTRTLITHVNLAQKILSEFYILTHIVNNIFKFII